MMAWPGLGTWESWAKPGGGRGVAEQPAAALGLGHVLAEEGCNTFEGRCRGHRKADRLREARGF